MAAAEGWIGFGMGRARRALGTREGRRDAPDFADGAIAALATVFWVAVSFATTRFAVVFGEALFLAGFAETRFAVRFALPRFFATFAGTRFFAAAFEALRFVAGLATARLVEVSAARADFGDVFATRLEAAAFGLPPGFARDALFFVPRMTLRTATRAAPREHRSPSAPPSSPNLELRHGSLPEPLDPPHAEHRVLAARRVERTSRSLVPSPVRMERWPAMSSELPSFRYHPDPLATGAVKPSAVQCACCGQRRGFVYVGPVYGETELDESLCPWCIADGSAAANLGASFADDTPLLQAGVPELVVQEVHLRTPAFSSWQQEQWLAHCGDACAFLGDASVDDVAGANEATRVAWKNEYGLDDDDWLHITKGYQPRGNPAFYKFQCLHCEAVLLGWDCT